MDKNQKFKLEDIHFITDQETGWASAFIENYKQDKLKDILSDIFYIQKARDSEIFTVRYGIAINKFHVYSGLDALDILDQHKLTSAISIPKTYMEYKSCRSNELGTAADYFAETSYVPVKDIAKICKIIKHHETKERERMGRARAEFMVKNGMINKNNGRDF